MILLLGLIYLLLRFANKPLSRFIARLGFSIRSACFLAAPACAYTRWEPLRPQEAGLGWRPKQASLSNIAITASLSFPISHYFFSPLGHISP